jgi:hypothetical protein
MHAGDFELTKIRQTQLLVEAKEQRLRLSVEEVAVVERERAGDAIVAAARVREGETARARWREARRRC